MKEYKYLRSRPIAGLVCGIVLVGLSGWSLATGREPGVLSYLPVGIIALHDSIKGITTRIKTTEDTLSITAWGILFCKKLAWSQISGVKITRVFSNKIIQFRGLGGQKITVTTTMQGFDEFWSFAKSHLPAHVEVPAL